MVKDDPSEDINRLKPAKTMLKMSAVTIAELDGSERSRTRKLSCVFPDLLE